MSKYYVMPMFPYPSGDSMHVGHASNYIINDFVSRYKKMQGFDVIHPMGFDSFGLPTENYAIKTGKSARQATKDNIVNFKEQIKAINLQFDPEREFATSDPEYYKWTQWIFARLFEHGLAYKKDGLVNRCNGCQTVLANDQVVDGKCERCETIIIQKKHPQRYIKTTALANELIDDLDSIDRPEETKTIQKNWIGRSFGAEIDFTIEENGGKLGKVEEKNLTITVFTTRPDTLYGVTALVLAPENQIIDHLLSSEKQKELEIFRNEVAKLTSIDRQSTEREKNGMNSEIFVTHPLTQEQVPVWFADYVLMDYATGAVMMVPAHDERDREFAKKNKINSTQVCAPYFTITEGRLGVRNDKPTTEREMVTMIVKHSSEDKYLLMKRKDSGAMTLPSGGIEPGDTTLITVEKELNEETGYKNFKTIQDLNHEVHFHQFAPHKDENRYGKTHIYYVELENLDQDIIDPKELALHEAVWVDKDEVIKTQDLEVTKYIWEFYIKGFVEAKNYKLINSAQFDGIDNITAKTKITEYLESLGYGRKKTTFRLRDRSVSRQRYRGSPIPVYYTFEENEKVPYRPAKEGIEIKEGMPIVTRQVVKVAIKHRSENKYLLIKNDKLDWHLVAGGVEAGETWEQAAIREAKKETIYTNFRIIKHIDSQVHSCFYNLNKEQNRYLVEELVVLQLIDNEESQSDLAGYQFKWIDESELGINLSYLNEQYNWFAYYDQSKKPIPPTFTDRYNAYNPHPDKSKWIPHLIPDEDLPVKLPLDLPNYKPAGKSPLEDHPTFKYYPKNEKVSNIVFLHGFEGDNETRSLIEAQCKEYGIECYNPSLIDSKSPDINTHLDQIIREYGDKINEDTIIFGHSLGGITAQQLISKLNKKIKKLVLLGSSYPRPADKNSDPVLVTYRNTELDIEKINSLCSSIEFWFNKDDPAIPYPGAYEFYKNSYPQAHFKISETGRHFMNETDGENDTRKINYSLDELGIETNQSNQLYLRECDTLDTFMCSSFYFLRYLDPANTSQLISHTAAANMPVDLYIGGKEHAVGHLIYSRFIYKFLQKYGYIETEAKEPFVKLIHQGMVHASDGRKFSKRRGNGINPLDVVKEHNTDTLRTYLAFMGPIELPKNWNSDGVAGVGRFLKRFEKLVEFIHISPSPSVGEAEAVGRGSGGGLISIIHQTIKAVGEDMDNLKFNTAISKLMIATNAIYEKGQVDNASLQNLIILLTPFAPETAQRMWTAIGQDSDVTKQARPTYDSQLIHNSTIELPIQINGKTKGSLSVSKDITQDEAVALVRQDEKMSKYLEGGIKKIIRVPGRICNIIV